MVAIVVAVMVIIMLIAAESNSLYSHIHTVAFMPNEGSLFAFLSKQSKMRYVASCVCDIKTDLTLIRTEMLI